MVISKSNATTTIATSSNDKHTPTTHTTLWFEDVEATHVVKEFSEKTISKTHSQLSERKPCKYFVFRILVGNPLHLEFAGVSSSQNL